MIYLKQTLQEKSNDSSHDDDGNSKFSKVDVVDAKVDDNKGKEVCHAIGKNLRWKRIN